MFNTSREFGPFIPECRKRGLSKTVAYELLKGGLLETFTLGSRRYVYLDSLLTLPQRVGRTQQRAA